MIPRTTCAIVSSDFLSASGPVQTLALPKHSRYKDATNLNLMQKRVRHGHLHQWTGIKRRLDLSLLGIYPLPLPTQPRGDLGRPAVQYCSEEKRVKDIIL